MCYHSGKVIILLVFVEVVFATNFVLEGRHEEDDVLKQAYGSLDVS